MIDSLKILKAITNDLKYLNQKVFMGGTVRAGDQYPTLEELIKSLEDEVSFLEAEIMIGRRQ